MINELTKTIIIVYYDMQVTCNEESKKPSKEDEPMDVQVHSSSANLELNAPNTEKIPSDSTKAQSVEKMVNQTNRSPKIIILAAPTSSRSTSTTSTVSNAVSSTSISKDNAGSAANEGNSKCPPSLTSKVASVTSSGSHMVSSISSEILKGNVLFQNIRVRVLYDILNRFILLCNLTRLLLSAQN